MSSLIAASPEAMMELVSNIGEKLKQLVHYNENLSANLNNLNSTFNDEGFDIIHVHVNNTKIKIQETLPEFKIFLGKLSEIAALLKKSENVIENTDNLNWVGKAVGIPAVAIGLGMGDAVSKVPEPIVRPVSSSSTIVQPIAQPIKLQEKLKDWVYHKDGSSTYDHPEETGKKLNYRQGYAVKGFQGTCGIVSSQNVLTMAGINTTEKELIEFCSKEKVDIFGTTLCRSNNTPENNGGTTAHDRMVLLRKYGLSSELQKQNVDNIAKAIENGKGVIISVKAEEFYPNINIDGFHAVTVTSLTKDKNGNVTGFWITDSGKGDSAKFFSKDHISKSLSDSEMNVTTNKIRKF